MKTVVFDFETSNFDKGNPFDDRNVPVCIALLIKEDDAKPRIEWFHFHDRPSRSGTEGNIRRELTHPETKLVGHNIKFDLHWLTRLGWEHSMAFWDTVFPAHIARQGDKSRSISLGALTGEKQSLGSIVTSRHNWAEMPPSWAIRYCIQDVIATYNLYLKQTIGDCKEHTTFT